MAKMVDALKLKAALTKQCAWLLVRGTQDISGLIDSLSIEAEPIRYGKWKVTEITPYTDLILCSECDMGHVHSKGKNLPNYCEHCGARNEGPDGKQV